jgi:hypothetical protein
MRLQEVAINRENSEYLTSSSFGPTPPLMYAFQLRHFRTGVLLQLCVLNIIIRQKGKGPRA